MPGYAILLIMIGFVVLWLASMIAFGVWFFRRTKRRIAQQYPELHSSQLVAEAGQQHRATLLRTVTFWLLLILLACLAVPLVIHYGFKKPVGETLILTWRLLWPAFWTCMGLVALVGIVRYAVDRARRGAVIIDLHKDNRIRSARKAMCFYPFMAAGFIYIEIENGRHITAAIMAVSGVAVVMYWAITTKGTPQLTERGIFTGGRLVPWEMVQTYEWTSEGKYLTYRLKALRPMFHFGTLQVEEELRDRVSELFEQRIKNATEGA